ncbi:hypothetical protein [Embleya hyalina]|uniref:hypothetical protein n=1 Tax=Embleya hyalina TaxID=516124 RepID=UPI000F848D85|nr:hypothetical protein [Embleya hyalina]
MPDIASPAEIMSERLLCCICGRSTSDSEDYVLLGISSPSGAAEQWLGAHAEHLNGVLARGFSVEVHMM